MFNHPYLIEQMMDEKLADLRAEGMRSQMLAQAGLQNPNKIRFPVLQRLFHQMLASLTRHSLRGIEQPRDLRTILK